MILKKVQFAIKAILAWVCLSSLAFANSTDDNFWRDFLAKHYPRISSQEASRWQSQTIEIFKSQGINHSHLSKISQSDYFKLWNIAYESAQRPKFEDLILIVDFWISELGLKSLNQFLNNTTHSNPYHIFTINLEGWIAFRDLLLNIGVFDEDPRSDRSVQAFLLRFNWAEGIATSKKMTPEFWNGWKDVFLSHKTMKSQVTKSFSVSYLSDYANQDLIQRLYVSLPQGLLTLSLNNADLISSDLLIDFINSEDKILRSGFDATIEDTLRTLNQLVLGNIKISGRQFSASVAKSVVAKLVFRVMRDPNIIKNERYLKYVIKEILSDLKEERLLESTRSAGRICGEYLK